ncbi:papilin-like [Drosophila willistoni]|uniref:papilin-like n=1 Tax=Drosophila willistoni TaxID=7260 RepID=UPI001F073370|nr:papilin-like [Drosophila willistoni]
MKVLWILFATIPLVFSDSGFVINTKPVCSARIKFGPTEPGCNNRRRELWSYDRQRDKCENWVYTGCKTVLINNFTSAESCHKACVRSGIDLGVTKGYHCRADDKPTPEQSKGCPWKKVWSYDPITNKCTNWSFAGCMRGGNIYDSYPDCQHRCIRALTTVHWYKPKEDCLGIIEVLAKPNCQTYEPWSFIQLEKLCKPSYWGSCKFSTKEFGPTGALANALCVRRCYELEAWLLPINWESMCKRPINPRPEKTKCGQGTVVYSYNRNGDDCVKWKYYGCEILGNYYPTLAECRAGCVKRLGKTQD